MYAGRFEDRTNEADCPVRRGAALAVVVRDPPEGLVDGVVIDVG